MLRGGWGIAAVLLLLPAPAVAEVSDRTPFVEICDRFAAAINAGDTRAYEDVVAQDYLDADSQTREGHLRIIEMMAGQGARLSFSNLQATEEPRGVVHLSAAYVLEGEEGVPRITGTWEGRCRYGQGAGFAAETRWALFWSKTTPDRVVPPVSGETP